MFYASRYNAYYCKEQSSVSGISIINPLDEIILDHSVILSIKKTEKFK